MVTNRYFGDLFVTQSPTDRHNRDSSKLHRIVESSCGVTLVGGGEVASDDLKLALGLAPDLVAADGGAHAAVTAGHLPQAVIGDMDSLGADLRAELGARVHHIPDQNSTDFDKCLNAIRAPFVLALGFTGARLDHTLAAMSALARFGSSRVLVMGGQDICLLAPPRLCLPVPPGARVSLYPLAPVMGRSRGLQWPIDGIGFTPDRVIGTSNRADAPEIALDFDAPGMLLLLERDRLRPLLQALTEVSDWPESQLSRAEAR